MSRSICSLYGTREATERLVQIPDSNYVKEYLKQVSDNATQLNAEERTQILSILKYFEEFLVVL